MNMRIVPEHLMTADLDAEIRRGLCACFPNDVAVFSQSRAWHASGPAFSAVLQDGPAVIAHTGVVDRTIDVDGQPVRAAGVQNVYVLPKHRRKGYVDEVMNAAMREAGRQGFDCGLLFCLEVLVKVYARSGWRLLENVETTCLSDTGVDESLPPYNLAMWYPLARTELAARRIHLRGRDW